MRIKLIAEYMRSFNIGTSVTIRWNISTANKNQYHNYSAHVIFNMWWTNCYLFFNINYRFVQKKNIQLSDTIIKRRLISDWNVRYFGQGYFFARLSDSKIRNLIMFLFAVTIKTISCLRGRHLFAFDIWYYLWALIVCRRTIKFLFQMQQQYFVFS